MKTKYLPSKYYDLVKELPNFSKDGSIKGMRKLYYGKYALLVKCRKYIFNVTCKPDIYDKYAY